MKNKFFFLYAASSIYASQKKMREVPPYRDPPGPVSPPQRTLPPYRDPPPPNLNSPGRSQYLPNTSGSPHLFKEQSPPNNPVKSKKNLIQVCNIFITNFFF